MNISRNIGGLGLEESVKVNPLCNREDRAVDIKILHPGNHQYAGQLAL